MSTSVMTKGIAEATESLKQMLSHPWSYFPQFVGGDLVGIGQVGPTRFIVAFGKTWSSGTANQADPPIFSSPVTGGPRVFDVDASAKSATEITSSLLLTPNASLRAAVMAGTGMHLVVSNNTGTHAQFIQHFASVTVRSLAPAPLTPASWANGSDRSVEWDRGAAHYAEGFFAIGADDTNQLYASRVRTLLSGANGYDPSRRSYLSNTGWTRNPVEQTPLMREGGVPLISPVPVALTHRRQQWLMLVPKQVGGTWGWELLGASSLNAPFRHLQDLSGHAAGPTVARFLPGIVLETDPLLPPGVAWSYSPEAPGSFVPRIGQLQV